MSPSLIERGASYHIRETTLRIAEPRQVTFAQVSRMGLDTGDGVQAAYGIFDGWLLLSDGYIEDGAVATLDAMHVLSEGLSQ